MLIQLITPSFILKRTSMSVEEMTWAFENGIIGAQTAVAMATALVTEGNESQELITLAGISRQDLAEVNECLKQVDLDSVEVDAIRRKWTWLLLSWVYENRQSEADVLQTLDALYADLGYPEEMNSFGPYAPTYQTQGDPAEMREQIMTEWRRYLKRGEEEFGLDSPSGEPTKACRIRRSEVPPG